MENKFVKKKKMVAKIYITNSHFSHTFCTIYNIVHKLLFLSRTVKTVYIANSPKKNRQKHPGFLVSYTLFKQLKNNNFSFIAQLYLPNISVSHVYRQTYVKNM